MASVSKDVFANMATITVTESAANTLTYKKLETGVSLTEKVAWLISRIEYFYTGALATDFNTSNDELHVGLSVSNVVTTFTPAASFTDPTLLDEYLLSRADLGAAASGIMVERPYIKDLSTLPGGGILVPPTPLFGWAQGVGLAAATTTVIKLFYTLQVLAVDQYWELVEARRIISS